MKTKQTKQNTGTREAFITNQLNLCRKLTAPFFMSENGVCYKCGRDIIPVLINKGEDGSKELVTGCPICHRTYCD